MTHWSTAQKKNGPLKKTNKCWKQWMWLCVLFCRGIVGGAGQTDPVRLKSPLKPKNKQDSAGSERAAS